MPRARDPLVEAGDVLHAMALDYPEATLDHPWGHDAYKVRKKVFLFLSREPGRLGLSLKLPASCDDALANDWAEPTGYGLGKHGWVSAEFKKGDRPPLPELQRWLDESYRAVAPKTLSKQLDEDPRLR